VTGAALTLKKIEMHEYPKSRDFDEHVEIEMHLEKSFDSKVGIAEKLYFVGYTK
jgi:hypothetical protein